MIDLLVLMWEAESSDSGRAPRDCPCLQRQETWGTRIDIEQKTRRSLVRTIRLREVHGEVANLFPLDDAIFYADG